MTPPASSARTPSGSHMSTSASRRTSGTFTQPTAFGSTGQRFTREQLANRPPPIGRNVNVKSKGPASSPRNVELPRTPPMLRKASYDEDAVGGDFSDAGFYDDDDSFIDGHKGR